METAQLEVYTLQCGREDSRLADTVGAVLGIRCQIPVASSGEMISGLPWDCGAASPRNTGDIQLHVWHERCLFLGETKQQSTAAE